MEHILSSIFPRKLQSNENSLQTISLKNSSILVHIDTTTFASPVKEQNTKIRFEFVDDPIPVKAKKLGFVDDPIPLKVKKIVFVDEQVRSTYGGKGCVMGCKDYKGLHRCPSDETSREIWRQKLKLKDLKKHHRVCGKHFDKQNFANRKRLPGWAVPDSASDSEENFTIEKDIKNLSPNFPPRTDVKLSCVLLRNKKETGLKPKFLLAKNSLSLEDILACK